MSQSKYMQRRRPILIAVALTAAFVLCGSFVVNAAPPAENKFESARASNGEQQIIVSESADGSTFTRDGYSASSTEEVNEKNRVLEEARQAEAARIAEEQRKADEAAKEAEKKNAPPTGPYDPDGAKEIARELVSAQGWDESQFSCLVQLWNKESGWNTYANNKNSGAYGIPQALPGSKMSAIADDWQTNPRTQITWGISYITGKYKTPCGAWEYSQAKGWY